MCSPPAACGQSKRKPLHPSNRHRHPQARIPRIDRLAGHNKNVDQRANQPQRGTEQQRRHETSGILHDETGHRRRQRPADIPAAVLDAPQRRRAMPRRGQVHQAILGFMVLTASNASSTSIVYLPPIGRRATNSVPCFLYPVSFCISGIRSVSPA